MKYRKLGKTGIDVSEVGFGCWQLGDKNWGGLDGKDAKKLVDKAIELGCNFFDTAPYYGEGRSEEILGDSLKGKRDKAVIVTKFGHNPQPPSDFSANKIRFSVERSLRKLKTDYIDSVLLHNPPEEILRGDGEHYEIFEALKKEGKIRSYGASIDTSNDLETLMKQPGAEVAEIYMHALHLEVTKAFSNAIKNDIGLIVKVPLDSGWLTGKYRADSIFNTGFRERWTDEVKQRRYDLVEKLRFLEKEDQTMAQGALRFLLDYGNISTLIPGAKNITQLTDNLNASNSRLSEKEVSIIKNLWENETSLNPLPW